MDFRKSKTRTGSLLIVFFVCDPLFADEKTRDYCKVCHNETVQDFLAHPHSEKGLDCDTCHGQSIKHRNSQGETEPDRIAAPHEMPTLCGACHTGKGRTTIQEEYASSKHGQLVLAKARVRSPHCGTCHGVHSLRLSAAIESRCRRCHTQLPAACAETPPSGRSRVACASCHAPHVFAAKK